MYNSTVAGVFLFDFGRRSFFTIISTEVVKYLSVSLVQLLTINNLWRAVKEEMWNRIHQTPAPIHRYVSV